jgi:integrase
MPKLKLTDRFIASKECLPAVGKILYIDTEVRAFGMQASSTGQRSFGLKVRFPSNPKHPSWRVLGHYGLMTLSEAREKARDWKREIKKGIDPAIEEEKARSAVVLSYQNNFGHVAEEFLARYVKGPAWVELERQAADIAATKNLKPAAALRAVLDDPKNAALVAKSKKEGLVKKQAADSIIRKEFIARWKRRPINDIQANECAAAIREIVKRGTPEQARSAFEWLRRLFSWALGVSEFKLVESPVTALRPVDMIGHKLAKDRTLNNVELRAVWDACGHMGHPYGPAVRMLILSGQRLREVAEAPLAEFDLADKTWVISSQRMKGEHGVQLVPLGPMAHALVKGLPKFSDAKFTFSTDGRRPVNGWSKAKARLDGFCGVRDWTFHDLRRSMRSHLSALPIEEHVRELMIGHKPGGIKAVYDRHLYEAEKRAGFELWENRLRGILAPKPPAEVANLESERAQRA